MTDPVTPIDGPDAELPAPEEEPETAETGAWMGERDEEPSDSGEPPEA